MPDGISTEKVLCKHRSVIIQLLTMLPQCVHADEEDEIPPGNGRQPSRAPGQKAAPAPRQRLPSSTWGALSAMAGGTRVPPPRPQRDDVQVQNRVAGPYSPTPAVIGEGRRGVMFAMMEACMITNDHTGLELVIYCTSQATKSNAQQYMLSWATLSDLTLFRML